MRLIHLLAFFSVLATLACTAAPSRSQAMQFTGPNAALERAIDADDPRALDAAIAAGADANARGARGVTPLAYAVGTLRRKAAAALIARGADPNRKDDDGDNAVTLAATAYARDPQLLAMVLDAGGDPNTALPSGPPLIVRFGNDRNLAAMTWLHKRGADIDADDEGWPLVVGYAYSVDWDVVWHLIELGARTDTPRAREGLIAAFGVPEATLPDSPLYPAKVRVWRHLKAQGANPPPPAGM
jgi:uncharacterized protein